jgi:hypothetical protein
MTATQGGDADGASQYVTFRHYPGVYRMLRLRYALLERDQGFQQYEGTDLLPRLLLVHESRVLAGRDAILQAMSAESFDPRRTVILEQQPSPPLQPASGKESVALIDSSTDHLDIEARLSAPGLLLVTDGYSPGWVASALPGSDQQDYQVLPANYVLRGIPLAAGQHRLRLEYAPAAFERGRWISLASLALVAGLALAGRRARPPEPRAAARAQI